MNVRILLLASMLALTGVVATAPSAAATCYLDPDDPVPGVMCGVYSTASCVRGIVFEKGTCAA